MSFKRCILSRKIFEKDLLDSCFAAIGANISSKFKTEDPDIEDTLLSASVEAVNLEDGRIAGLLVDWISIHFERINVDRLTAIVTALDETKFRWVRIFWCANAERLANKDIRFRRLSKIYSGKRLDYLDRFKEKKETLETKIFLEMKGEDERFKYTCIRVPKNIFSHRPEQIFPAETIAKRHLPFRYRIMLGPSYRADMWAALKRNPELSAAALAEIAYGSYATAHQVKKDFLIIEREWSGKKVA